VRKLAQRKCETLSTQLLAIEHVQRELTLLLNLCCASNEHCPILER